VVRCGVGDKVEIRFSVEVEVRLWFQISIKVGCGMLRVELYHGYGLRFGSALDQSVG